jgi:2-phospho-L-lactate transferase/gluconeogenesis factor (CofD/UPF0052 family)
MTNIFEPMPSFSASASSRLHVVLFSGGRGSGALSQQLVSPQIDLTIAINGYDDGASTGEVRRFLGDSLGPSDFRKNASRLAAYRSSCPAALIELLDLRLPDGARHEDGVAALHVMRDEGAVEGSAGGAFNFSDCSVGNIVFAGCFLRAGRAFNAAVDDYCALLSLPAGIIENVTDGTNALLVALDCDGRLLASEEEIVDSHRRNRIDDIFLIDHAPTEEERTRLASSDRETILAFVARHARSPGANPRLLQKLAAADLIVYAPGTQHSSLFPSYLTSGISRAVAANLRAAKLMITNIRADAEITGSSATEIMHRAVHYLRQKGQLSIPIPCLITHCLINDPGDAAQQPYVPLGALDTLDDPRLVRVGHYEDGMTGLHHASKVLHPFLMGRPGEAARRRIAVYLHDATSCDKIVQTMLEFVRGGIEALPVAVTMFYRSREDVEPTLLASLPFAAKNLGASGSGPAFHQILDTEPFDYVVLFESSGMYIGEDAVRLIAHVAFGRLDAVWGSRRLSVRRIQESYRLRYRHKLLLGATSYVGSHVLSLGYLLLFGRYVSDSLSAARAVRSEYVRQARVDPADKQANHHILSALLRDGAELIETPIWFCSLSPERVRRTSVRDGLRALLTMARWWLKPRRRQPSDAATTAHAKVALGA